MSWSSPTSSTRAVSPTSSAPRNLPNLLPVPIPLSSLPSLMEFALILDRHLRPLRVVRDQSCRLVLPSPDLRWRLGHRLWVRLGLCIWKRIRCICQLEQGCRWQVERCQYGRRGGDGCGRGGGRACVPLKTFGGSGVTVQGLDWALLEGNGGHRVDGQWRGRSDGGCRVGGQEDWGQNGA
jgi:hypothetical protein